MIRCVVVVGRGVVVVVVVVVVVEGGKVTRRVVGFWKGRHLKEGGG